MRALVLIMVLLFGSTAIGQQLKEITNSIGMKLVLIHAGSFTMGSPASEDGRQDNEIPHEVKISKSYYLCICEVTNEQFEKVIGRSPSQFQGKQLPVSDVTWKEAIRFCNKLSLLPDEKKASREYRLPTEAEWEYACRATSTTSFCFGETPEELGNYAWVDEGPLSNPHPVGTKKPNRWGLFDMHGNVSEWCQDLRGEYPDYSVTDPKGFGSGWGRVYRGGGFYGGAEYCRSASRTGLEESKNIFELGFRIALSLPDNKMEFVP